MDVSIIIVSWRVKELILKCLESIYSQTQSLNFEVFVVDNDSQDGVCDLIKRHYPQVTTISNQKNIGFGAACNQAIKKSQGETILLLNPDTIIHDNCIKKTYNFINKTSDAGIVGCKILNNNNSIQPSVRSFPSLAAYTLIMLKLHHLFPNAKALTNYYKINWDYNKTGKVDQVMGAFFMIKRGVLKKVGLFDKHFFVWFEEVDLCQRALKKGYYTYYYCGTYIKHYKGKSFSQLPQLQKQLIFNRSLLYFFFKHHSVLSYFCLLLIFPFSMALALFVQLFKINKFDKN